MFHRTLGLADLPRHFFNALLLDKPQHDHTPLLGRQRLHQAKQGGPPLDFLNLCRTDLPCFGLRRIDQPRIVRHFPPRTLPAVGNQVGRDAKQPRRKRYAPPFKPLQVRQRLVKDLRRQIFRLRPVPHALDDIGIYALKIDFVKVGKAGGVLLRSFDQKPLVRFFLQSLQRNLRGFGLALG